MFGDDHYCTGQKITTVTSVSSGVTSPCKAMLSTAVEEKQELRSLTDQLACLMNRMRTARQSVDTFDASSYRATICSLEDEISKIKDLYENELSNLRCRLEQTSNCKASTSAMYDAVQREVCEMKNKLAEKVTQVEHMQADLTCTRSELVKAKQTITDLTSSIECLKCELHNARPNNYNLEQEMTELRNRLECEMKFRATAEETVKTLNEKLDFEIRRREQISGDLNERLRSSSHMIQSLEMKLKETSSTSVDYKDVLAKLRAGTECELQRYKAETEEALNRNLAALRMQIDSEKSVRCELSRDKGQMEETIACLRTRIADFEGQMSGLIKQRDAMEQTLRSERARACSQIRELEVKLGEMNSVMLNKVKECTDAREAQVSLKTEIDAFKVLLHEADKGMNTTSTTTTTTSSACKYNRDEIINDCKWRTPTYKTVDTELYIKPRPPPTPRRSVCRPTSAHASCYKSTTRIAPCDDRVFQSHFNTEVRSSVGTGACSKFRRSYDTDDIDVRKSNGKRVTLEFEPEAVRRVSVKDDIEVTGKGISTCYSPPFPKRSQNWGECYTTKKGDRRPRSSRPITTYHTDSPWLY